MSEIMELGLVYKDQEAEEFLMNEHGVVFTSEQLRFFREARRIYKLFWR